MQEQGDLTQDLQNVETEHEHTNRRALMKVMGAAAAGVAVAAVARPGTAGAAEGGTMLIGAENEGTSDTVIKTTATLAASNIFTAADSGGGSIFPSALGGFANGTHVSNGIYAFTSAPASGLSNSWAILAGSTSGARSQLMLFGGRDPRTSSVSHRAGEIMFHETAKTLFVCIESGTPGTWRELAGPSSAGAFHAIDPIRVFDSRVAAYGAIAGIFAAGSNRVIPIKDARDGGGTVTAANAVPAGATAVAINLTITGATAAGFASVAPGTATSTTASSINFQAGADVANGFPAKLDTNRQLKVFMGPGTSAHVLIDVQGYYI